MHLDIINTYNKAAEHNYFIGLNFTRLQIK